MVEGCTYFVTKKTNDDLCWLKPDPEVNVILLYLLILKSKKYGIRLHEFCFLSNHFHLLVTDPNGQLPAFMREFLGESAKALKIALKTDRRIWSGTRYSAVEVLDLDAARRKAAYTLLNPTEAGLTLPGEWAGLTSASFELGDRIEAVRPEGYFSPRYRPDSVSLELEPIPEVILTSLVPVAAEDAPEGSILATHVRELANSEVSEECEQAESGVGSPKTEKKRRARSPRQRAERRRARRRRASLLEEVDVAARRIVSELRRAGQKLVGAKGILATSRSRRGSIPFGGENPRFATLDADLMRSAKESSRVFEREHAGAVDELREGRRGVRFPRGTYGYRSVLSVRCEGTSAPA